MSHSHEPTIGDDELVATQTAGYKPGEKKTLNEYSQLDAEDESLARWKASLGIGAAATQVDPNASKLELISLSLVSPTAPGGAVTINLQQPKEQLHALKDKPLNVKEGVDYSVKIIFKVGNEIISGLKYLQVVKRSGLLGEFFFRLQRRTFPLFGPRARQGQGPEQGGEERGETETVRGTPKGADCNLSVSLVALVFPGMRLFSRQDGGDAWILRSPRQCLREDVCFQRGAQRHYCEKRQVHGTQQARGR
ncbi:rho GDP dissociation inhibitor [Thecaphora frezii]